MSVNKYYQVQGFQVPLKLRSKHVEGPFVFTAAVDGSVGLHGIEIFDKDLVLQEVANVVPPQPSWFIPTGNTRADVLTLGRLISQAFERNQIEEDVYEEIKENGIERALPNVANHNDVVSFAKAAQEATVWTQDSMTLADLYGPERNALESRRTERLTETRFLDLANQTGAKEIGKGGNHLEYDQTFVDSGPMFTQHMGPCITIGLSGISQKDGKRYNALHHSFQDFEPNKIFENITSTVKNVTKSDLEDVRYFVVGGSSELTSRQKATRIGRYVAERELPIEGCALGINHANTTKSVMISGSGKVTYAMKSTK